MNHSPEVIQVLNEIEALKRARRNRPSVLKTISDHIGKPYSRVYEWVISRKHTPSTDVFMTMKTWTDDAKKSLNVIQFNNFKEQLDIVQKERATLA